ncbi:alpha/beta hydrolase [Ginsengibacter hankyongi]|uniref:Alpha/beta hydrolase n=1 Tax=Ginsengibacter hankyongi TaxID=2607284 RepID=A0A5J5IEF6_9BACT|nr:alpha/beta hydrolase [Ginsengibacter hankyongi]KAA9037993.1 alpha/beta hydrolase [Ginsengibacter hankyongi]
MFYALFKKNLSAARERILASGIKTANTRLGKIEYIAFGKGLPVLWIHGIVGGADQGIISSEPLVDRDFRIIAVSRFGYIGSPLPVNATPAAQADLYAALLDALKIPKVAVVGFSSGAPSALQFALRHPDRCSSLILLSGAVPPYTEPPHILRIIAKIFFGSDFIFWILIKYFPSIMMRLMGVPKPVQKRLSAVDKEWLDDTMFSFLPVRLRVNGIINDIWVTNPDLNKGYPFQELTIPTLIIHAVDDPMPSFKTAKRIAAQIPRSKFVTIESGGHLHMGHHLMVRTSITNFILSTKETKASVPVLEQAFT